MYQYRITKYDPKFRNASGAYTRNDWTAVSDVGKSFDGKILEAAEYLSVENAYVESLMAFLSEASVETLRIDGLENRNYSCSEIELADGRACSLLEISDIARLNLRETIWCRLVSDPAFVHFGYDYYMYIGVCNRCPVAIESATQAGLFVESFESPYHPA